MGSLQTIPSKYAIIILGGHSGHAHTGGKSDLPGSEHCRKDMFWSKYAKVMAVIQLNPPNKNIPF